MTRKEEAMQAAAEYYGSITIFNEKFVDGVLWADEHNPELERLREENQAQAATLRKMSEQLDKSPWISVEERLPEGETVIGRYTDGLAFCCYSADGEAWYILGAAILPKTPQPTHWMPIPELPTTK
ncbi:MAG: DUF551 domain-containing protein [Prevotella sp.]|nr:DUF551 domain-containing protein [Prevotella sp.]